MPVHEAINNYLSVAEYLSKALGPACEISLLDIGSRSVAAIYNAFSGIKVGSPVDKTMGAAIDRAVDAREAHIINQAADNGNVFSALLIQDGSEVVGALCILKNLAAVSQMELSFKNIIEQYTLCLPTNAQAPLPEENRVKALLHSMVSTEVNAIGIHPTRLTLNEKAQIVKTLSENGTMMIEGAVSEIARQLFISEPTVYRYLNRDLDHFN